mmetsp:Transcript_43267/g.112405  ORF Transcript_43267/g.112405 Transcript_43267/m.112405 type:complete len:237 (-) Transcript_43267:246-956(-)
MARCEAELPRDGHHGMLALAGARGLAAMGGEAAAEAIKPFMEKGVLSDYGRRGAISAFGRAAGQATERSYRQAAAAHLAAGPIFDDVEAIRRAALGALASVGESSFATVIENAKGTIAEQHYARELLVHIRKLRKASAGEDQAERIGKMIESVEKKHSLFVSKRAEVLQLAGGTLHQRQHVVKGIGVVHVLKGFVREGEGLFLLRERGAPRFQPSLDRSERLSILDRPFLHCHQPL